MNTCEILLPAKYQITAAKNPACSGSAHSHAFFELDFVQNGRCLAELGGHSLYLSSGCAAFLPPDTPHFVHANEDCIWYPSLLERTAKAICQCAVGDTRGKERQVLIDHATDSRRIQTRYK